MTKAPTFSAMSGEGVKNRPEKDSEAINFAELYPDNHISNLEVISAARRLLAQALRQYDPEIAIEEGTLRYISELPDEYRHHPQFVHIGFKNNGSLYIVRFNRKADGNPDLTIKPSLDPPIKKMNF